MMKSIAKFLLENLLILISPICKIEKGNVSGYIFYFFCGFIRYSTNNYFNYTIHPFQNKDIHYVDCVNFYVTSHENWMLDRYFSTFLLAWGQQSYLADMSCLSRMINNRTEIFRNVQKEQQVIDFKNKLISLQKDLNSRNFKGYIVFWTVG